MTTFSQVFLEFMKPGSAEALIRQANHCGNFACSGLGIAMQDGRNAIYVGSALSAIAATGAVVSGGSAIPLCGCAVIGALGLGLTIRGAQLLYRTTSQVVSTINYQNNR